MNTKLNFEVGEKVQIKFGMCRAIIINISKHVSGGSITVKILDDSLMYRKGELVWLSSRDLEKIK